jgi:hypothetical protein
MKGLSSRAFIKAISLFFGENRRSRSALSRATAFVGLESLETRQLFSFSVGLPGFELSSVTNYNYNPSGTAWTFSPNTNPGGSGIAANGGGFTSSNPSAPEGTHVAFL